MQSILKNGKTVKILCVLLCALLVLIGSEIISFADTEEESVETSQIGANEETTSLDTVTAENSASAKAEADGQSAVSGLDVGAFAEITALEAYDILVQNRTELDAAIAGATPGATYTIAIGANFNISGSAVSIPSDKNIVLVSEGSVRTLTRETAPVYGGDLFENNGTLLIKNLIIDGGSVTPDTLIKPEDVKGSVLQNNAGGNLTLDSGAVIQNNIVEGVGGGIHNEGTQANPGTVTITGTAVVQNNTTAYSGRDPRGGGGIMNKSYCTLNVTGNAKIRDNKAADGNTCGAGIYNYGSAVLNISGNAMITGNAITYASNSYGSGVYNYGEMNLSENAKIDENTDGGTVYSPGGTINLSGGSISNNNVGSQSGAGAIYLNGAAALHVLGSVKINNNTGCGIVSWGTGVVDFTGDFEIKDNGYHGIDWSANRSGSNTLNISSGTISGNSSMNFGGGLYVNYGYNATEVNINISGTAKIDGNHAATGSSTYPIALGDGGGIYVSTTSNDAKPVNLTLSGNASVSNNTVASQTTDNISVGITLYVPQRWTGGGIFIGKQSNQTGISRNGTEKVTIIVKDNAVVSGNSSYYDGAGIFANGDVAPEIRITDSAIVSDNQALNGMGGGIYLPKGALNINGNASINDNSAKDGGGLFASGAVDISGTSTLSGNQASRSGGGASVQGTSLKIRDAVSIKGNTAVTNGGGIAFFVNTTLDDNVVVEGNSAGTDGGGIWCNYSNLDKLNVGGGVAFRDNSASQYYPQHKPSDDALYDSHIYATSFTTPFTQGYNNYDISYSANKYTVTFESNGGSTVGSLSVVEGNTFTVPANPSKTGYRFDGWYEDDGTFRNNYLFGTQVTGNLTLYANWIEDDTPTVTPPAGTTPPAETPAVTTPPEAVRTIATPEVIASFTPQEVSQIEAQTGNIATDLANDNVPRGDFDATGVWSLLNLILSLLCLVGFILMLISAFRKREYKLPAKILRLFGIAMATITIIAWVILDKLQMPTAWLDRYSPIIIALFSVFVVATITFNVVRRSNSETETEV